jgi:hypothetical protein
VTTEQATGKSMNPARMYFCIRFVLTFPFAEKSTFHIQMLKSAVIMPEEKYVSYICPVNGVDIMSVVQ